METIRSGPRPLTIVLIVLAAVVGLLGAIGGIGYLYVATAEQRPLTERDRRLLITAEDLAPYFYDFEPSDDFARFEKERYFDGSSWVDYTYDSPLEDEPWISCSISYERKLSDALTIYATELSGQRISLQFADDAIDTQNRNDFFSAGDQSTFADITYDGAVTGHCFVIRQGRSVLSFMLSGFVMDDPAIWRELLSQRLKQLDQR